MALEVEDGTGKANSESYISVADADARHTALGNADWIGATNLKEEALRRATVFMLQAYRQRWIGTRRRTTQALDWPRIDVIVDKYTPVAVDTVPSDVANACADLALKALAEALAPDLERGVIREKVGPIETEYDRGSPQAKRYRAIEMMLAPYLKGGSGMARLVRA